jgi:hypothetical protein
MTFTGALQAIVEKELSFIILRSDQGSSLLAFPDIPSHHCFYCSRISCIGQFTGLFSVAALPLHKNGTSSRKTAPIS